MPQEQVNVTVVPCGGIAKRADRQDRAFDHGRFDARRSEKFQDAEQFGSEGYRRNCLIPMMSAQLIAKQRRQLQIPRLAQSGSDLRGDSVNFGQRQERIRNASFIPLADEFREIALGRAAGKQERPVAPQKVFVQWKEWRQSTLLVR